MELISLTSHIKIPINIELSAYFLFFYIYFLRKLYASVKPVIDRAVHIAIEAKCHFCFNLEVIEGVASKLIRELKQLAVFQ